MRTRRKKPWHFTCEAQWRLVGLVIFREITPSLYRSGPYSLYFHIQGWDLWCNEPMIKRLARAISFEEGKKLAEDHQRGLSIDARTGDHTPPLPTPQGGP